MVCVCGVCLSYMMQAFELLSLTVVYVQGKQLICVAVKSEDREKQQVNQTVSHLQEIKNTLYDCP